MRKHKLMKATPVIFSGLAAIGTIAVGLFSAKATLKVHEILEKEEIEREEAVEVMKAYFPVALMTASVIFCIFSSNKYHKRIEADLASAYMFAEVLRRDYKKHERLEIGDISQKTVEVSIAGDLIENYVLKDPNNIVMVDNFLKIPFEGTIVDFEEAKYQLNRLFSHKGYVSLYDFYQYLGVPETDFAKKFGWSVGWGEMYGYNWIDIDYIPCEDSKGNKYIIIQYDFDPIFEYIW